MVSGHTAPMKTFTDYLWFTTPKRKDLVNITEEIEARVKRSGVREGFCLVSAMHITAAIWVNDEESGLKEDVMAWLEKLAPASFPGDPARGKVLSPLAPAEDYKHHRTGEDNADAHLKRTVVGHQAFLPITEGKLDLGPWEQIFYMEFDGQRRKRVVVKILGL